MSNKNIINWTSLENLSLVVSLGSIGFLFLTACGQLAEFLNQDHGIPLLMSWGISFFTGLLVLAIPLGVLFCLLRGVFMYIFYPFYWIAGHFNIENK